MKSVPGTKRISIRYMMSFAFILILLIPFITQLLMNFDFLESYKEELIKSDRFRVNTSKNAIEFYLRDIVDVSSNIYSADIYRKALMVDEERTELEKLEVQQVLETFIAAILFKEHIRGVYIYTNDGRIYSGNANHGFIKLNENLTEGEFIQSLYKMDEEQKFISLHQPYQLTDGVPVFSFVKKIVDSRSNVIGMMLIDIDPDILGVGDTDEQSLLDQHYFIVDDDRKVIYSSNEDLFVDTEQASSNRLFDASVGRYAYESEGVEYLITYDTMKFPAWRIVLATPIDKLHQKANDQRSIILSSSVGAVIIALIAAGILSTRLTKPLAQLTNDMKYVELGNFDITSHLEDNKEVYLLSNGFNSMISMIDELMEKEFRLKLLKQEAEYKMLQAQINPHFLYNTLESISAMAEIKGVPEVGETCYILSNMFRYSIGMETDRIPLFYELDHVEDYLRIMKLRFEQGLTLKTEIADDFKSLRIQRLTLQPLVENAVVHGFKDNLEDNLIQINVTVRNDMVYISVKDNGSGMTESRCRALMADLDLYEKGGTGDTIGNSIGLRNIHSRYRACYGPEYGISDIQGAEGAGTTITIVLPMDYH